MTGIKICGLKSLKDIYYANMVKPDYVGFVFADSKRQVNEKLAYEMKKSLDKEIKAVGVFVNEPIDRVVSLCKAGIIDLIQLHGEENEEYVEELRAKVTNNIIKAIRVKSKEQILQSASFPCDYFLFDTFKKGTYGGTGESFDRKLIPDIKKPYFLAGGITIDNVKEAISECRPFCVDISSGVETSGNKDIEKMRQFVETVRRTDS